MSNNLFKKYYGQGFDVRFYPSRCIHAAECLRNLPEVFDVTKRPWINPDNATAEKIYETVRKCPSGALQFVKNDEIYEEDINTTKISVFNDSQLVVRGNLEITDQNDEIIKTKRITLCGCGKTANSPLCDLSCRR